MQVEDLLNDQQIAEKDLEDKRAEQQSLVEKYNDEILAIAKSGVKKLSLNDFLEQKEGEK